MAAAAGAPASRHPAGDLKRDASGAAAGRSAGLPWIPKDEVEMGKKLAAGIAMLALILLGLAAGEKRILVVCSPGSPGSTLQAQPTMDQLAGAVAQTASWPAEALGALYFETAEAGRQRLESGDAAWALVS